MNACTWKPTANSRLQHLEATAREDSQAIGFERGVAWAEDVGAYGAVCRIATFDGWAEAVGDEVNDRFFELVRGHCSDDCCSDCIEDAWAECFGDEAQTAQSDSDMLSGFINGVISTYLAG